MFSKKGKNRQNEEQDILNSTDTELMEEIDLLDEPQDEEKRPKKKLPAWVIFPVLGVVVAGAFGISALTGGGKTADTGTILEVTDVTRGTVQEVYNSSGTIESENTKTYYSPVTAPIKECKAEVGQTVKAGDLLVSFDTTNLERDNEQAQLTLQSSLKASEATRAQNAKAVEAANAASAQAADQANALADEVNALAEQVDAAYAQYQANLEAAGTQAASVQARTEELQNTIAENQEIVNANQSIIDSTDSGYAGRRADLDAALNVPEAERTEEQIKTISDLQPVFEAYDAAVAARNEAQAAIDAANSELQTLSASTPDVDDAGYTELKAQYDAKYAEWQAAYQAANTPAADAGMTAAESENLDISDNLAELTALTPEELLEKGREGMKADMDGVIASVDSLQTNSATQGVALFSIASMEKVRVRIEISPDDYARMKTGTAVTITVGDKTYEGTLTSVDNIAVKNESGTPVIGAQIHINNPDEDLCIGATAKVRMTVAESKNTLVVPTSVVNASTDGDFVYVIRNDRVAEQKVELGISSSTEVEILSGLKEGDQVVSDLNVDIEPGMRAIPQEASSDQAEN